MKRLVLWFLLVCCICASRANAQTYYDQQRQYQQYRQLQQATQRAYSVPASTYQAPSYRSSSSSSSSSYYSTPSSYNYNSRSTYNSNTSTSSSYSDDEYDGNYGSSAASRPRSYNERLVDTYNERKARYDRISSGVPRTPDNYSKHMDLAQEAGFDYYTASRILYTLSPAYNYKPPTAEEIAEKKRKEEEQIATQREQKIRAAKAEAEKEKQDIKDIDGLVRSMATATQLHPVEIDVYAVLLNVHLPDKILSAEGSRMVLDGMQARRDFKTMRATAGYDTLYALLNKFLVMPVSVINEAPYLAKRFPMHEKEIMRAELRAVNFFYSPRFADEYKAQRLPTSMHDSMEARWMYYYQQDPAEALMAIAAITDPVSNPMIIWSRRAPTDKERYRLYTLLVSAPVTNYAAWLEQCIPDVDWKGWKAALPQPFVEELTKDNLGMMLAILDRNRKLK